LVRSWLESCRGRGMSLGLDSTQTLLNTMGNPERRLAAIHVAGSNGKGTTCAMLTAGLVEAGQRVGTFTSPHVARIEERVRIDGRPVAAAEFDIALNVVREASEVAETPVTFFEATYLAAMHIFSEAGLDYIVLEVGLGGRLDATNTCHPVVSIITALALEHTEILGSTLDEIAVEKSAIARQGVPLILRRPPAPITAENEIQGMADAEAAKAYAIIKATIPSPKLLEIVDGWYDYRDEAACLANRALMAIGETEAAKAVDKVKRLVKWAGRMQTITRTVKQETSGNDSEVEVLLDCAHNPSGMSKSIPVFASSLAGRQWCLCIGSSPQNNLDYYLAPLASVAKDLAPKLIVVTEPQGGRYPAIPAEGLSSSLREIMPAGVPIVVMPEVGEAWTTFENALANAGGKEAILGFVTGSIYLTGNLLEHLHLDGEDDLAIL